MPVQDYISKIEEARPIILERNISDLQGSMLRAYASQIDRVVRQLNSGKLKPEDASLIIEDISRAVRDWQSSIEDITKRYSVATIDDVAKIHAGVVAQAAEEYSVISAMNLNGFRSDAFEAMFVRRGLNTTNTFQTLNNWNAHGKKAIDGIDEVLQRAIAEGEDWLTTTRGVARSLTFGEPSTKALFEMTEGRFSFDMLKSPKIRTLEKLMSDARRIAITEIQSAYHEAERVASIRNPLIKAIKWQTSGRHDGLFSSPDICDIYEEQDLYDLGPGVYFPETLPVKPHPNCACTRTFVRRDPKDLDKPKDSPQRPKMMDEAEVTAILNRRKTSKSRSITPKFIQQNLQQTNRDNQRAYLQDEQAA